MVRFLKHVQKLTVSNYGNSFFFQRDLGRKDRYHKGGRLISDCIYNMLVFRDTRRQQLFGDNIRIIYMNKDGTSKIDLGSFYRSILGAQLLKTFSRPETNSNIMTTVVFYYELDKRVSGPH